MKKSILLLTLAIFAFATLAYVPVRAQDATPVATPTKAEKKKMKKQKKAEQAAALATPAAAAPEATPVAKKGKKAKKSKEAAAESATPSASAAPAAPAPAAEKKASKDSDLLDLNTATQAQLTALPGLDAATADKIIAGRPYKMKSQLKSKKIIDETEYKAISDKIIAHQAK
jgi:DNA uptake protein ComE-like DNA-binding protein